VVDSCAIAYTPLPSDVSYAKTIAPMLQAKCVDCHSPGNVGPFALSSHRKVRGWTDMIDEVVMTGRMPPWSPDPVYGDYKYDRALSPEEKRQLIAWLRDGAENKDGRDPLAETPPPENRDWPLGEPDLVVTLPREQAIDASGVFAYRYVDVPSGLTEDKWVRAVDVRPTNPKVTHHVLVFASYPSDQAAAQPVDAFGLAGYFAGYVPGTEPTPYPQDTGKFVPAGTSFVFQLHYTATGKDEVDRTRMGLYFHDRKPKMELETRAAELERANEELRMHDRAKDGFLTNVSHELRTPLATIQGYVEMLESGQLGEVTPPQQSALQVMNRNVGRLIGHINEIIEFSRMEIRGVQLQWTLVAPKRLAEEAVSSIRPHVLTKDLSVNVFASEELLYGWMDREKIAQVLSILLNNATKFTPSGGMIQLRAEAEGDAVVFEVKDTGVGIPSKFHEQVFSKFFQVDASMTRQFEGTGIGLSIAKSITEAHGGSIELESESGQGSTFRVKLPGSLFRLDAPELPGRPLEDEHVLVLDSTIGFGQALSLLLEREGARLTAVETASHARRIVEEEQPRVLIVNDAGLDSSQRATADELSRDPVSAHMPVLACISEDAAHRDFDTSTRTNVRALRKPFDSRALLPTLLDMIEAGEEWGEAPTPAAEEHAPPPQDTRPHVLVLDADPDFLEWMETALNLFEIPCLCAGNLQDAAELLRADHAAIIFADVDGLGKTVKDVEALTLSVGQALPVCVMSAMPVNGSAKAHGRNGVAAQLRKPFAAADALAVIQRHCAEAFPAGRRPRAPNPTRIL